MGKINIAPFWSFVANKATHAGFATALALVLCPVAGAAQDATKGEQIFRKCKSCHQIGEGAKHKVGPVLSGVVGRPAGSEEGYKYSKSMRQVGEAGLIWNETLLVDYLAGPKAFLRAFLDDPKAKAKMSFRLKKEQDRLDIVAYLATFSDEMSDSSGVCVRNVSDRRHFFAAEVTGAVRVTGWLNPSEQLCAPADAEGAHGLVSVFESDQGFEGCSRVVQSGQPEELIRYADFDRCEWGSHNS